MNQVNNPCLLNRDQLLSLLFEEAPWLFNLNPSEIEQQKWFLKSAASIFKVFFFKK
jgi:hypothetical protein